MNLTVIAAATVIASYNCQLEKPRAISFQGAGVAASEIGLPPATLAFSLAIHSGNPMEASVSWPGDPFQMAGTFPVVGTAPGGYSFSTYSSGPCLFTEQACLTQVNLVNAGGSKANLILTPVALILDDKAGTRTPFAVLARGQCTRTDSKP